MAEVVAQGRAHGIAVSFLIWEGDPAEAVIEAAESEGADLIVIGNRGRVEIDARQAMGKDASIIGMTLFNISDPDMASINSYMMAGLANGTLTPVVGREFALADAAAAQEAVMAAGAHGKIVLLP